MAINFPNAPITGSTYDFQGVRYTYQVEGYWAVTTPGTVGIATALEVIDGLDPSKYITPEALKGSDYITSQQGDAAYENVGAISDHVALTNPHTQYFRKDVGQTAVGNNTFYHTVASGGYQDAPIHVREVGIVGTGQSSDIYAPKLAFHWGSRQEASILLKATGGLYIKAGASTDKILHDSNVVWSDIDQAVAEAGVGSVGSYAFASKAVINSGITQNSNYAGSSLRYAGVNTYNTSTFTATTSGHGSALPGTWKAMGYCGARVDRMAATLFLRIS